MPSCLRSTAAVAVGIACAVGAVLPHSAVAVQSAASAAAKGRITPLSVQVTDPALPVAARKTLTSKIDALVARVLATPALTDPRGFSIRRSARIDTLPEGFPASHPARAEAIILPQEIDLEHGAKPDAAGAYMGRLEGPTFRIFINDLMAFYANAAGSDPVRDIQYLPLKTGSVQGFPVYRVGVRDVVVVTKPGREPFVNVTKGEYLQKLIDETRATIAEIGGTPHPKMQATLDEQTAALAALSPLERAEPACVSARLRQVFGDCSAADASFYVRPNLDYFDKGAPKGAVQLVAISSPAEGGHGHPRLEPRLRAAAAALDFQAIQASLD
ncbi:hypothetical protein [Pedomonas mirosovicensis]|uniref:hypothetical protein n=1 Tax=Pedomonas mirosovicensis TaxID=2908641 RepID=UPI0021697424|nr:hypothetical protein [Pedomonas mirosovicensis]MCH8686136.1 hypothetical protein [Pedomonas mirosovicensis]